jgi:hypothetical protein
VTEAQLDEIEGLLEATLEEFSAALAPETV